VAAATLGSVKGPQAAFTEIPIIDVSGLFAADAATRRGCGLRIGDACRDVGFFYAVGHGIDQGLRDEVFALGRRFFALPLAEKMAVAMSKSPNFRGYLPLDGEVTDPVVGSDPKEGFDIARELAWDDPDVIAAKPLLGPNQWPARPPELRRVLTRYYDALTELGRVLSRAFALALDLDEDFFAKAMARPTAILRLLHYPAQHGAKIMRDVNGEPLGCGAHSDYGYLTILAQDAVGGLQVQNRAGSWVDARPVPGAYVCNIGEMMAQWTNDRFAATKHRVLSAPGRERYSVPFFFHPNYDTPLECLPSCHSAAEPPRYAPTTSGRYLLKRLSESYV
jgi:isopenicillin N synthase-like dioxygenase